MIKHRGISSLYPTRDSDRLKFVLRVRRSITQAILRIFFRQLGCLKMLETIRFVSAIPAARVFASLPDLKL